LINERMLIYDILRFILIVVRELSRVEIKETCV